MLGKERLSRLAYRRARCTDAHVEVLIVQHDAHVWTDEV